MDRDLSTSANLVNSSAEDSDGGQAPAASTSDDGRLSGVAPQPCQVPTTKTLCGECGSDQIQSTAWVTHNTGEIVQDEGPTDDYWCPDCETDCTYNTVYDYGHGFELWREAEWSGWYATFAEALAEAKESDRPYEIVGARGEVTR